MIALAAAPFYLLPAILLLIGSDLGLSLAGWAVIAVLMICAAHLIVGVARQPVLGIAVVAAAGALTAAWVSQIEGVNAVVALLVAALAGGCAGVLLSLLCLRLDRWAIAGLTLVAQTLVAGFDLAGPSPSAAPFQPWLLGLGGALAVLALALLALLDASPLGRAMAVAGRQPTLASVSGASPDSLRSFGMVLGCALAGAAGGFFALGGHQMALDPLGLTQSLALFALVLTGGAGSLTGALLAGLPLLLLPEVLALLVADPVDLRLPLSGLCVAIALLARMRGWRPIRAPQRRAIDVETRPRAA